jgi:hypothetical protein
MHRTKLLKTRPSTVSQPIESPSKSHLWTSIPEPTSAALKESNTPNQKTPTNLKLSLLTTPNSTNSLGSLFSNRTTSPTAHWMISKKKLLTKIRTSFTPNIISITMEGNTPINSIQKLNQLQSMQIKARLRKNAKIGEKQNIPNNMEEKSINSIEKKPITNRNKA